MGCLRVEVIAAEWGAPRSDTWNLGRWRRHMEREARGVPPSRPAAVALPNPLQMPVGLGVPGDRLAAGGPSQVLVPRPPAPGPDSAPMSPPCPQTPLWAQPTCVTRQLRGHPGPAPLAARRGNQGTSLMRRPCKHKGADPHGKCLIKGNCSFYRPGSQDTLNLGAKPYNALQP